MSQETEELCFSPVKEHDNSVSNSGLVLPENCMGLLENGGGFGRREMMISVEENIL